MYIINIIDWSKHNQSFTSENTSLSSNRYTKTDMYEFAIKMSEANSDGF